MLLHVPLVHLACTLTNIAMGAEKEEEEIFRVQKNQGKIYEGHRMGKM